MYRYKRLLVGISFCAHDQSTVRYAAMISRLAKSEKVFFLHVARSPDAVPRALRAEYAESSGPASEFVRQRMEAIVADTFEGCPDTELQFEVAHGSRILGILGFIKRERIDLVVVGKRQGPGDDVSFPVKLTRKAACSVLAVPGGTHPELGEVLVPVDFSELSVDALEVGIAFASASGRTEIKCLHAYGVPSGYYSTGKTYEQFAEVMRENAQEQFREFISRIDCKGLSVAPIFKLEQHKIAAAIREAIDEHQVKLLIVATRWRETLAGLLLGHITRSLIKTSHIPILIVKEKETGAEAVQDRPDRETTL
ncbi:MAG: universal stress protein [bacterium]